MKSDLKELEVFPWNKNFETGIKLIDDQHQKLVQLLNELAITLTKNDPSETIRIFDELADYANYHFETEEAIWLEHFGEDAWLSSHQLTHLSFLPRVVELKAQHPNKPLNEVVEGIVKFLIRWLAFHIIDNDKRMSIVVKHLQQGKTIEEAKLISDKIMNSSIRLLIDTVLSMYDTLSSRSLNLIREKNKRQHAEQKLSKANLKLRNINTKLKQLVITDQLTNLHNRRHFNNVFERELKRAYRDKNSLTLIILDIDFFKNLNDHYGHSAGDEVLIQVAQQLKNFCQRPTDYAFRLGGEEFCILAAKLDNLGAEILSDIIRKGIEALRIPNINSHVAEILTVSIGTFSKIPTDRDTIDDYMSMADKRLYKAKELGRNRVVSID